MRAAKWIAGILAGVLLLAVLLVAFVTLLVNPNRFKGRIEALASEAIGQPFHITGDLDIAWYPWLALRMGAARVGETPALAEWKSASVGARLLPLIRGQLVVSRVRLDSLRVHLERDSSGRGNWEDLIAARAPSQTAGAPSAQMGGLEIRNGVVDYRDARSGRNIQLHAWRLDVDDWKAGEPLVTTTRFAVGGASVEGEVLVANFKPFRAEGSLVVQTASLRELLTALGISGPRPVDPKALASMKLEGRWSAEGNAFTARPLRLQLDETSFSGEITRASGENAIVSFGLKGDRIVLDRYVRLDDRSTEPFELPVETLKALPVAGVVSFAEAQMAGATIRNARIRFETPAAPATPPSRGASP